eukprot:scaffold21167_cov33-Tisochrysis_lutea.AAC.1
MARAYWRAPRTRLLVTDAGIQGDGGASGIPRVHTPRPVQRRIHLALLQLPPPFVNFTLPLRHRSTLTLLSVPVEIERGGEGEERA